MQGERKWRLWSLDEALCRVSQISCSNLTADRLHCQRCSTLIPTLHFFFFSWFSMNRKHFLLSKSYWVNLCQITNFFLHGTISLFHLLFCVCIYHRCDLHFLHTNVHACKGTCTDIMHIANPMNQNNICHSLQKGPATIQTQTDSWNDTWIQLYMAVSVQYLAPCVIAMWTCNFFKLQGWETP